MRRLSSALVCLMVLAARPAAAEDSPSFDCDKAAAPVEVLICGDQDLSRLDARLAAAFKRRRDGLAEPARSLLLQEQRDWLKRRLQDCAIPAKADANSDADSPADWERALCLEKQYLKRLAALGAPETLPTPAPGFIHPLCVFTLSEEGGAANTVPLDACNRIFRRNVVSPFDGNGLTTSGEVDGKVYVNTRPGGTLPDGTQVVVLDYSRGGAFSYNVLYGLKIARGQLSGKLLVDGGETCHNGIVSAAVVKGRLQVAHAAQAAEVLRLGDPDLETEGLLDDIPCYARVIRDYPPAGGSDSTVLAVTVDLAAPEALEAAKDTGPLGCLHNRLIAAGGQPGTIPAAELPALVRRFKSDCLSR